MNKLYFSLLTLIITFVGVSQQQLVNSDFENWTTVTVGVDDPPNEFQDAIQIQLDSLEGGIWGSGNTLIDTLDDVYLLPFLQDTTYSHSGNKAVLLRTQMIGPLPATGTLWTGYIGKAFDLGTPLFGAKTGTPFTGTPSNFKGYIDYKSVQGDSCQIACYLTKWNGVSGKRDTVGGGIYWTDQTTNAFIEFDVPIFYNTLSPSVDSIIVLMLSSYGGVEFRGKEGSTLIVDSIYMEYGAIALDVEDLEETVDVKIYSKNGNIIIDAEDILRNAKVEVYDITGKLLYNKKYSALRNETINIDREQIIIVKIDNGKHKINRKIFVKP